ncbi:MAG: amidohydrolase [Emcibacter sp.]|nr:amidohydrolase [Emcibacter sp.]
MVKITRREALLSGSATLGLSLAAKAAGMEKNAVDEKKNDPKTNKVSKEGPYRSGAFGMPIICLEEHVHDRVVATAIKETFLAEVPYLSGIGTRYREDPSRQPADRPRLTFIPDSIKTAAEPLSARISAMDKAAIDYQVISLSNATQLAPQGDAVELARGANDRMAEAVAKHPGRFSAFFTLPWQNPEAAVREAERCVRVLKLPATLLTGRPANNHFLDDPRYEPVLAKLAELDAPLFIHPGPPLEAVRKPYYDGFNPDLTARLSLFGWGWHHEAGIQVVRLILSGIFDRHPNLKIISGHWGEMVPFFLQRMDDTMPPEVTGLSRTISDTYRDQVWVGPSGMLNTPHFMFIRQVLGIERIIFSIDYPYLTMSGARDWLESLQIPQAEKEAIAFRNAQTLLHLT